MSRRTQFAKAASIVVIISIISKILGYGRDMTLAAYFGASGPTDAYTIAFQIPGVLFASVGASVTTVFIPVLSGYLARREKENYLQVSNTVLHLIALSLGLLALAGFWAAPWLVRLIAPGFTGEQYTLTVQLTRIMLPGIIFMGLSGWAKGVLEANKHFTAPAAIGLPFNVVVIGAIILLSARWGIAGVAAATVLAILGQVLIQVPVLPRVGYHYRPVIDLAQPGIRQIGILLVPVLLGTGAGQLNAFVDKMLASGLEEGSVAALNFAMKLNLLPMSIFGVAIFTVLFPSLSEQAAMKDYTRFQRHLVEALNLTSFILIPMMVGMVLLAEDVVRLALERGAFDARDTAMTAFALTFYGLGLTVIGLRELLNRAFWALQDTATPMWIGAAAVGVNIGLNLVLVRVMGIGGLALATSVAAGVGVVLLLWGLRRKLGHIGGRAILVGHARSGLAALVMGAFVYWLRDGLLPALGFGAGGSLLQQLERFSLLVAAGALVYGGMALLLRAPEVTMALDMLGRAWHRFRSRSAA